MQAIENVRLEGCGVSSCKDRRTSHTMFDQKHSEKTGEQTSIVPQLPQKELVKKAAPKNVRTFCNGKGRHYMIKLCTVEGGI